MYQLNYSRDDIHLVAKDNRMNAPVQAIRVQETQEKHTNFTMIPNVLIDGFDELSDAARFAFIKFMRLVRKVGYFAGSITTQGCPHDNQPHGCSLGKVPARQDRANR